MHGDVSVCLSVCPSVRPSVTRWYRVKTVDRMMMRLSPTDIPGTLLFFQTNSQCLPRL